MGDTALKSYIGSQLHDMIADIIVSAIDILVHIAGLEVEFFAEPIAKSSVQTVLIKSFSVYIFFIPKIEEYFILQSRKEAFVKRLTAGAFRSTRERHKPANKIPEPVGVH